MAKSPASLWDCKTHEEIVAFYAVEERRDRGEYIRDYKRKRRATDPKFREAERKYQRTARERRRGLVGPKL